MKVTDRHTAIDYAHTLRDLSDVHFPDAGAFSCREAPTGNPCACAPPASWPDDYRVHERQDACKAAYVDGPIALAEFASDSRLMRNAPAGSAQSARGMYVKTGSLTGAAPHKQSWWLRYGRPVLRSVRSPDRRTTAVVSQQLLQLRNVS